MSENGAITASASLIKSSWVKEEYPPIGSVVAEEDGAGVEVPPPTMLEAVELPLIISSKTGVLSSDKITPPPPVVPYVVILSVAMSSFKSSEAVTVASEPPTPRSSSTLRPPDVVVVAVVV